MHRHKCNTVCSPICDCNNASLDSQRHLHILSPFDIHTRPSCDPPHIPPDTLSPPPLCHRTCRLGRSRSTTFPAAFSIAWQLPSLPVLLHVGPPLGLTHELAGARRTNDKGSGRWLGGNMALRPATAACFTCTRQRPKQPSIGM